MANNRIVHICLACFYYDGMSYQENMLVKKHLEMGYQVHVISFCDDMVEGKRITRSPGLYIGQFGEPIHRIPKEKVTKFQKLNIFSRLSNYHPGLYKLLEGIDPNIIFVHGPQTKNVYDVIRYKRAHPETKVYADNHADFINSRRGCGWIKYHAKNLVYGVYARALSKITNRFWGTTPARCAFLMQNYRVKKSAIGFLPTGVDENKLTEEGRKKGAEFLAEHGVQKKKGTFLIISGGKFDSYKNLFPLLNAYGALLKTHPNISLILFGTLDKKYEDCIKEMPITFLGWLDDSTIINIMMNSDLTVFTGGHSTIWEESVGIGLPGVFMYYKGFQHINFNHNVVFIENNEENEILGVLDSLLSDPDKYKKLANNAMGEGRKQFFYSEIAKNSIS